MINAKDEILVTDEFRLGTLMMKFPGGGLEFGEGTIDCLKRECIEELGQGIRIISHFYTTDYYQPTKLIPDWQQLISIYYLIETDEPYQFTTVSKKFDIEETDGAQSFRWISIAESDASEFTFPIDEKVFRMLQEKRGLKENFNAE